jgi:hypothetical protein
MPVILQLPVSVNIIIIIVISLVFLLSAFTYFNLSRNNSADHFVNEVNKKQYSYSVSLAFWTMISVGIILLLFSYLVYKHLHDIPYDTKQFSGVDCDESMCTDNSQIKISS